MGRPHKKNRHIINKLGKTVMSAKSLMYMVENILKHLTEENKITYVKTMQDKINKLSKIYLNQSDYE